MHGRSDNVRIPGSVKTMKGVMPVLIRVRMAWVFPLPVAPTSIVLEPGIEWRVGVASVMITFLWLLNGLGIEQGLALPLGHG